MTVFRWGAILVAIAAIVDPRVALPRSERPAIRLLIGTHDGELASRIRSSGFETTASGEAATVLTPDGGVAPLLSKQPVYVFTPSRSAVGIDAASISSTRVAGQAVIVTATVHGVLMRGQTTALDLEDAGISMASTSHVWKQDDETWQATLTYLPPGPAARPLRLRAAPVSGGRDAARAALDLLAPAVRGPIRTLVFASALTWPAVFVRRALEAGPGFAVDSVQRATTGMATRAGSPPSALRRSDLADYEVLVCDSINSLDDPAIDAVKWFVEERGGVLVFVPDRAAGAVDTPVFPHTTFEPKVVESPVVVKGIAGELRAAEMAVPRVSASQAAALAADSAGAPIVLALRRGLGGIIVSGALDAWRYRDQPPGSFAQFWQTAVLSQALGVPPRIEVTADPAVLRPGGAVHLQVRLRGTELPAGDDRLVLPPARAHAVNPGAGVDESVRLWPGTSPEVYEGDWRPTRTGAYAIDASVGAATASAVVQVDDAAAIASPDNEALAIAARASGGGVFSDSTALVRALSDRFPAATTTRPGHPARSPWMAAAFAVLLCAEWTLRRRQGLS